MDWGASGSVQGATAETPTEKAIVAKVRKVEGFIRKKWREAGDREMR